MNPVQGEKISWHFRHLSDQKCDPDHALHKMAQNIVIQSFTSAIEKNSEYKINLTCSDCSEFAINHNPVSPDSTISSEDTRIISGTRPDLVIREANEVTTILEIVVTHDLEDKTRELYKISGIPVFSKDFKDFKDLEGLNTSFTADFSLNVFNSSEQLCDNCKKTFEQRKNTINQAINLMKSTKYEYIYPPTSEYEDSSSFTTLRIRYKTKILSKMGFQQSKENPHQFLFPIHKYSDKNTYISIEIGTHSELMISLYPLDSNLSSTHRILQYTINAMEKLFKHKGIGEYDLNFRHNLNNWKNQ